MGRIPVEFLAGVRQLLAHPSSGAAARGNAVDFRATLPGPQCEVHTLDNEEPDWDFIAVVIALLELYLQVMASR